MSSHKLIFSRHGGSARRWILSSWSSHGITNYFRLNLDLSLSLWSRCEIIWNNPMWPIQARAPGRYDHDPAPSTVARDCLYILNPIATVMGWVVDGHIFKKPGLLFCLLIINIFWLQVFHSSFSFVCKEQFLINEIFLIRQGNPI